MSDEAAGEQEFFDLIESDLEDFIEDDIGPSPFYTVNGKVLRRSIRRKRAPPTAVPRLKDRS